MFFLTRQDQEFLLPYCKALVLFLWLDSIARTGKKDGVREILGGSMAKTDRLRGLVVRVSGYRYRGPGFDPRRYQIF